MVRYEVVLLKGSCTSEQGSYELRDREIGQSPRQSIYTHTHAVQSRALASRDKHQRPPKKLPNPFIIKQLIPEHVHNIIKTRQEYNSLYVAKK